MRKRIFAFTGILALIVGATIFVAGRSEAVRAHFQMGRSQHAGDGQMFGPEMVDHIARELNLNDSQKSQVKAFFDAAQGTFATLHQKMEDVEKQLETATANGQFDETQVRALASQKGQLMAEMFVEHERMKSKIYSILTPEQRAKADEMLKKHREHFGFH